MFSNYLMANSVSVRQNYAPKAIVAESEGGLSILGSPNFIKFNCNNDRLIVVS
jgi:hypothetical protein